MKMRRLLSGLAAAGMCLAVTHAAYAEQVREQDDGRDTGPESGWDIGWDTGQDTDRDTGPDTGPVRWELQFTDAQTGQVMLDGTGVGEISDGEILRLEDMLQDGEQDAARWKPPGELKRFNSTNQLVDNLRIQSAAGDIGGRKSQKFDMIGKYDRPASPEKHHWNIGDVVERELSGQRYRFQCIDQNYSDRMENHKPAALFLCMSVIPADFGSGYRYEEPGGYVFYPGPLVNFGEGNDYKYSAVRSWLTSCEGGVPGAVEIHTGVDLAYDGSTGELMFEQLDAEKLSGSYIGFQKMTDRLFCLSVDEALKYREYLWRFEGSKDENPESQYGPYSKGYWLRNPVGEEEFYDTGLVYIVDLVNGTIRPQAVKPEGESGDAELDVTGTTGVRPAFAMPQDS